MRKLLLASVAALGASAGLANFASAQTVIYSENPNAPQPAPQLFERKTAVAGRRHLRAAGDQAVDAGARPRPDDRPPRASWRSISSSASSSEANTPAAGRQRPGRRRQQAVEL